MTSDARGYTPATRDDLLPGAVFVVMQRAIRFPVGTLLKLYDDIEKDHCPRFIDHDDRVGWCSLNRLAVHTPGAAVTSHAVAAAEIARLRAEVAALREALAWQPIATAPRDGSSVLTYMPGRFCVDWFDPRDSEPFLGSPTHWMPLPTPPAQEQAP